MLKTADVSIDIGDVKGVSTNEPWCIRRNVKVNVETHAGEFATRSVCKTKLSCKNCVF